MALFVEDLDKQKILFFGDDVVDLLGRLCGQVPAVVEAVGAVHINAVDMVEDVLELELIGLLQLLND